MSFYVGIDLGGTELKTGIINSDGEIKAKEKFITDSSLDGKKLVEYIADCAKKTIEKSGINQKEIKGVGIGSPGLLDPEKGLLKVVTNIPQLEGMYLAPEVGKILNLPAFLDNDVNVMALGESYFGAAKGYKNVIALTLGTGVGGGLVFDGKLYRGACFTAGEIGHISIDPNGLYCPCGNYGCLERYVGRDGIVTRFKAFYGKGIKSTIDKYLENGEITPKAIAQAAGAGDELSIEVLRETGQILGIVLSSLTNVLNPDAFVIGGGIANAGELILGPARRELIKRAYTVPAKAVTVLPAKLKNDAGIVGGASLAVERLG